MRSITTRSVGLSQRSDRLAAVENLLEALLRETGETLRLVFIGDGAAADDRSCRQRTRATRVRDELKEREVHLASVGLAEFLGVQRHFKIRIHAAIAPTRPELVGRHEKRREGVVRLRLEKTELRLDLLLHDFTESNVVEHAEESDVLAHAFRRRALRHVGEHHRELAFKVATVSRIHQINRRVPCELVVADALVHERRHARRRRHLVTARFASAKDVREKRAAVVKTRGPRQRRDAVG